MSVVVQQPHLCKGGALWCQDFWQQLLCMCAAVHMEFAVGDGEEETLQTFFPVQHVAPRV